MPYVLLGIFILFIVCIIVLLMVFRRMAFTMEAGQKQRQMEEQNQILHREYQEKEMNRSFQLLNEQLQTLRKEQALGSQSIDKMQNDIQRMNQVMTNTKARGNWGEYQLEALLKIYAGENPEVFSIQYTLPNGKIADAILHLPQTSKVLCIDSKFPMENYLKMEEEPANKETYFRLFKTNMKKHIDDVSSKYINEHTASQAILFIPSESIYQLVCSQCTDILNYALSHHVLLTSPTTLVGVIFTLLASTRDFYRSNHLQEIEKNILLLQEDMERLVMRTDKATKTLEALTGQFDQVSISANKIVRRMKNLEQGREKENDYDN